MNQDSDTLRWLTLDDPHMRPEGLWWFDEYGGELFRYPLRAKQIFSGESWWVWRLTTHPSGARIRFRSDTTRLIVRIETWHDADPGQNMHELFRRGMELRVNDVFSGRGMSQRLGTENVELYDDAGDISNEFDIWLPNWNPARIHGIAVDENAQIEAPAPHRLDKPIVTIGTSITHGACASRPSMIWPGQVARRLNVGLVNLGATGATGLNEDIADIICEVDASAYLLKPALTWIHELDAYRRELPKYLDRIRRRRPDVPIFILGAIAMARQKIRPGQTIKCQDGCRQQNEVMLEAIEKYRADRGDANTYGVDGFELLGVDDLDGLTDAVHPNDVGFTRMADRLTPRVAEVLFGDSA